MYGIIRTIAQGEQGQECLKRTRIKPEGEYYVIQIDKLDEYAIKDEFFKNLYEAYKQGYRIAREKSPQVAALQGEEKVFNKIEEFLKKNSRQALDISKLYKKPSEWEQWRSNKCRFHKKELAQNPQLKESVKDFTAQVPLSPQLGKYLYKSDEGIRAEQQKICPLCISLALLGVLSYSVRMRLREGRRFLGWQFATLIPTKEASANDLSLFGRIFGKEDKLIIQPFYSEKMPELIAPLLLFKDTDTATLETLQASSPILFTYRFDPSPGRAGVLAVRKVSEYPASRLIKFYLYVKERASNEDRRLLDHMKWVEYSPYFSELALSILTKDIEHFYNFLRGFTVEKGRRTRKLTFFSQAFVEQALCFFSNSGDSI
jgi:hypothetical protein